VLLSVFSKLENPSTLSHGAVREIRKNRGANSLNISPCFFILLFRRHFLYSLGVVQDDIFWLPHNNVEEEEGNKKEKTK